MPQPGDLIDERYLIESVIGKGGMGCVLSARHMLLQTQVAIKLLKAQAPLASEMLERFLREGRAMASLRSEHVARIMDMGMTGDGAPYLVMEFLPGNNLAQLIRERAPLPVDEAVRYMLQVCEAILEAHAQGTFHRDIKPANIFVTRRPDGSPLIKVLDFGIAKVLAPGETCSGTVEGITQVGQALGTQHYMPPEQIRCARTADARSDIWSLGVVLYELVTGKRPFSGTGAGGIMASVVADQPLPPRSHRPDLPAPLDALIMQCLEKAPERRPQWVASLVAALTPFATARGQADPSCGARRAPEADPPTEPIGPAPLPSTTDHSLGMDATTHRVASAKPVAPSPTPAPVHAKTDPAIPLEAAISVLPSPEIPVSVSAAPISSVAACPAPSPTPNPETLAPQSAMSASMEPHAPAPAALEDTLSPGTRKASRAARPSARKSGIALGFALVLTLLGITGVAKIASERLAAGSPDSAGAPTASVDLGPPPSAVQASVLPVASIEPPLRASVTVTASMTSEPAPAVRTTAHPRLPPAPSIRLPLSGSTRPKPTAVPQENNPAEPAPSAKPSTTPTAISTVF